MYLPYRAHMVPLRRVHVEADGLFLGSDFGVFARGKWVRNLAFPPESS
jgi:hypothetical protein